ncbi:hypothetical protein BS333_14195 [Vibrio azureus]|uniref:Uncharacterized protein n=2 Tax=Vibrio harveyi group TaxID=717610 RepID=U3A3F3_9VIBR|nr:MULTISPECIES: hypothetical protein [Vibrio harveyi group]AUI87565.1 hypothetical protein BS333_14195 [Vibrio azureus]PNQ66583.1 hypothetical protein C1141_08635 [Vibrio agarivorans]GAD74536.1 hypothetical protein VAZ01S_012_00150 [Vibrio azureus NBRC 104587]GEM75682.1 hypothetical protein VSA01S_17940 [Vibrio sagamiensis NBRC 104589]
MSHTDASHRDAKQDNPPVQQYVMLREKRILHRWREEGETISLSPSQAEYHLINQHLELKQESK